ncbi:hypothetical protein ACI68E_000793 [Malassezia pachydermatis]
MRTSLSLVAIGVAIAQLFRLPELILDEDEKKVQGSLAFLRGEAKQINSKVRLHSLQRLGTPIGISFVGVGIFILLCGTSRFFQTQNTMIKGLFIPSRVEVFVLACVTGALLFAALGVMISVAAGAL